MGKFKFQRPQSDMNIASGSPFFMPLESLTNPQFIKDNVVFIKIIVDWKTLQQPYSFATRKP